MFPWVQLAFNQHCMGKIMARHRVGGKSSPEPMMTRVADEYSSKSFCLNGWTPVWNGLLLLLMSWCHFYRNRNIFLPIAWPDLLNRACRTDGHYWNCYPDTLYSDQVTATYLKISIRRFPLCGAWSSTEMQTMIGYQPRKKHQQWPARRHFPRSTWYAAGILAWHPERLAPIFQSINRIPAAHHV